MKTLPIILSFLFLILSFSTSIAQKQWELKKNKNGIKTYVRDVEGSSLKELKLKTRMRGSLSSVVAAFYDVDLYKEWAYSTLKTKVVKEVSETEMYFYSVSDFPWPFQDRDVVLRNVTTQDPITKTVTSSSYHANSIYPKKDGLVRVPSFTSHWKMTPTTDGYLDIEYLIRTEPGGNIPDWLVNMFIDKGPTQSIQKLQQLITKEPYKSKTFGFISN